MTETEEALATALVEGFNGVTDPDARQEKFTAEDFETHVRFLAPVVERLIALREEEARLDELRHWNSPYFPNAMDKRIEELDRQRDALLKKEAEHDAERSHRGVPGAPSGNRPQPSGGEPEAV